MSAGREALRNYLAAAEAQRKSVVAADEAANRLVIRPSPYMSCKVFGDLGQGEHLGMEFQVGGSQSTLDEVAARNLAEWILEMLGPRQ